MTDDTKEIFAAFGIALGGCAGMAAIFVGVVWAVVAIIVWAIP